MPDTIPVWAQVGIAAAGGAGAAMVALFRTFVQKSDYQADRTEITSALGRIEEKIDKQARRLAAFTGKVNGD